ncbi:MULTISPECIES: DUF3761 domain-containing protein [unclassified Pseudomonas]|uniref:DUF3761 domain-containing protein n=1 Tax=unclassified Pseudomonas TaxID=196821 RepID=UPI00128D2ECB|nr:MULTISPECIES: DUF3761 domain-containing protein [unclassified Pseudomonas]MPQ66630.1 DUF3761 domain-containing protein [Pseudomonas sp. MWU12-2323]
MKLAYLALAACLIFQPAFARSDTDRQAFTPDESQLLEHGSYINKDGNTVHSPAHTKSDRAPEGATAKCRDKTYSFSQHRRGTCSRHGGVMAWL